MKAISVFNLLLIFLLVPGLGTAQSETIKEVNPEAIMAMLDSGALFVDVREANEVEVFAYDLPGVVYLPLSELPDRLEELPRDQPIILACRSGKRSLKAAAILAQNDFLQLSNLVGGIIAWEAASMPVVRMERTAKTAATKQCCASKGKGQTAAKSCGGKEKGSGKSCGGTKDGEVSAKASCGDKGKGKNCCSGGS